MSVPVFVSVSVFVRISLSVSLAVIAEALTSLEDRQAGEAGLAVRVRGLVSVGGCEGGGGVGRPGTASQPLSSGDPDVRP